MKILTFDIEEWFHILDVDSINNVNAWGTYESRITGNVERLLERLDVKGIKATFFCLGWIAKEYPDVIKRIVNSGHEIGTHSHTHQLVYSQKPEAFKDDLETSIKLLEDLIGLKIKYYRSPGFSIKRSCTWAFDLLGECGIEVDCSIFPAPRAHGGMSNVTMNEPFIIKSAEHFIKELPMSTWGISYLKIALIGGGYFRLLPYSILRFLIDDAKYLMTYFHPRDFDNGQPKIHNLSLTKKFKSYYGLDTAFEKFCKFTDEFKFVPVSKAVELIDWSRVPVKYFEKTLI